MDFEFAVEVEVYIMIDWVHQEEGYCEGYFKSIFFRNDEKRISLQLCRVMLLRMNMQRSA